MIYGINIVHIMHYVYHMISTMLYSLVYHMIYKWYTAYYMPCKSCDILIGIYHGIYIYIYWVYTLLQVSPARTTRSLPRTACEEAGIYHGIKQNVTYHDIHHMVYTMVNHTSFLPLVGWCDIPVFWRDIPRDITIT